MSGSLRRDGCPVSCRPFYPHPTYNRQIREDRSMTDLKRAAVKITAILFIAQSLASAGFIAAAAINPILGAKLASDPVAGNLANGGLFVERRALRLCLGLSHGPHRAAQRDHAGTSDRRTWQYPGADGDPALVLCAVAGRPADDGHDQQCDPARSFCRGGGESARPARTRHLGGGARRGDRDDPCACVGCAYERICGTPRHG
ncbi:MAG: hypothetical protein MZV64_59765 [Ignavibacteriales bacterium]|nr:hypothetical protein [Ignavibacteriales bacterium]